MQQETHKQSDTFVPRRGLRNAHAQTLAGNFLPRTNLLPAPEERLFQVEEDAQVLCHCHWQPGTRKQDALTVIIVHGLEGSSESQYVLGTGSKAWLAGMNVVRMNMRNCGGTEELTPTLYHSGLSMDVGAVAHTLIEQDSLRHIALVGYSMGGNLVLKLAGEWGQKSDHKKSENQKSDNEESENQRSENVGAPKELIAVAGISPAMDLAPSADALHDFQNRMYEWKFMRGLRNRFRRKVALFPDRYDLSYLRNLRTIREFDNEITARYSGFTGADDYYTRASSSRVAEFISVPALIIHSTDDPFIRMTPATRAKLLSNPHLKFIETEHGGHCAFLADANGYDGRWAEKQVIDFFEKQMASHS